MAKKAIIAKPKVITIWLVTVKLNGTIPNKLQKKMNENIVKSIGKYSGPFFFTFSAKTLKYMNSMHWPNYAILVFTTFKRKSLKHWLFLFLMQANRVI
jgi:hypothetical protein